MTSFLARRNGIKRSASLLRALGPSAAPVWAELDPKDASAIAQVMDDMPNDPRRDETVAAKFLDDIPAGKQASDVWQQLSELPTDALYRLLHAEHPQVIALTLSRIAPQAAAGVIHKLPTVYATDILNRMLHMSQPHKIAVEAITEQFSLHLSNEGIPTRQHPDETVAQILDTLPEDVGGPLLQSLQKLEPQAGERVRSLMFTFADLVSLSPAGIQTLLSKTNRSTLTLALKGAPAEIATLFFNNMTQRARELLQSEIMALGPRPRGDVEAARIELIRLTRSLIASGDITPNTGTDTKDMIL